MKTFHALLIAALFTTAACKKKDEAGKTAPAKDPAAKTADPAPAPTPTPTTAPALPAEPGKADPAGAGVTVDQAGAQAMELTDKIVKASSDAGDDCGKFGTRLKAMTEEVKVMAANDKELAKDPAKRQEYQTRYEQPALAKLQPLMQKLEKCMETNADVKAFMDITASSE
jgi:hypothetical protein